MPSTWILRATLPSGASFSGQISYHSTNIEIPYTLWQSVESVSYEIVNPYINKYTGFETKKYRRMNTTGSDIDVNVSITLIGNLERKYCDILNTLARAVNGAGMYIDFYDDVATDMQYQGRWENAGDFVDNSTLLCGASIDLVCWDMSAL